MTKNDAEKWMAELIAFAKERNSRFAAAVIVPSTGSHTLACNTVKQDRDITAHAEVNAIRLAYKAGLDLSRAVLITTCEPCPMCASAAIWARIPEIYFGASINDASQYMHQIHLHTEEVSDKAWYPIRITGGILREGCLQLFEEK
jgi:tRNA(adenine34) deaminase